ncbi:hypothetical protein [Hymenobacter fodinae]|uniref:Uncharacterized protein n=1 Tax=Hymenobacter fodinae TaxID=2510796 RepID=A0A4Z0NYU6_9BACT|nr:hypothetical protein [Hymenobacter fodinae]TGE03336.1 hypothetical protein EU556_25815 [Hymenobacter fodinae]
MNYLSLINQFWAKDLEHSFTPNDIAVYFRLLERCNALGWKNPFNFSVDELLLKLRLKTKDPFTTARNRLKQAGLIDFKNGDGRGRTTTYYLLDTEEQLQEEETERGKKNTPLMPPLSPTLLPPLSPPGTPLLHKTKLNKTKEKTANAVTECVRGQDSELNSGGDSAEEQAPTPPGDLGKKGKKGRPAGRAAPSGIDPQLPLAERWPELVAELNAEAHATWERFVAWERDNPLPKLFQMAEPLLPAQLVALIHKHGSGVVTGVLQDMQNMPVLLTKYDSANLTAQSWLRRRQKQEKTA